MSTAIGEVSISLVFETKDMDKSIKKTEKSVESAANNMGSKFSVGSSLMQAAVTRGFDIASSTAMDFAKSIVDVGISFDRSMSQVAAISGATGSELEMP